MPRDCAGSLQLIYQHQTNQKLLEKEDNIGSLFNGEGFFRDEVGSSDSDSELKRQNENLQIQTGSISLEVLSLYLLLILYGLVGACAYILRTISQQLKERTSTNSSKIRLQLRMFLGALAGFSIAWFAKPTAPSPAVIS